MTQEFSNHAMPMQCLQQPKELHGTMMQQYYEQQLQQIESALETMSKGVASDVPTVTYLQCQIVTTRKIHCASDKATMRVHTSAAAESDARTH